MAKRKKAAENQKNSAAGFSAEVDDLARRTLDLWRDQMMALAQSPQAMQDFAQGLQPGADIFTQGFNSWMAIVEAFVGRSNSFNWAEGTEEAKVTPVEETADNDRQEKTQKSASRKKRAKKSAAKKPRRRSVGGKARAASAAAASKSGAGAVAKLAEYMADLEKPARGKGTAAGSAGGMASHHPKIAKLAEERAKRAR